MKEYSALSEEWIFGSVRREVLLYGVDRVYGVYHSSAYKSFSLLKKKKRKKEKEKEKIGEWILEGIIVDKHHPIIFMPVAVNTSGRVYDDFVRLIFWHAHREASPFK
jgi:hypothetical protein